MFRLVPVEAIIELWETAGLPNSTSTRLARDLGFSEGRRLRLVDLVTILESELPAAQAESITNGCTALELLLHATLALYQAEVRCLRLKEFNYINNCFVLMLKQFIQML